VNDRPDVSGKGLMPATNYGTNPNFIRQYNFVKENVSQYLKKSRSLCNKKALFSIQTAAIMQSIGFLIVTPFL